MSKSIVQRCPHCHQPVKWVFRTVQDDKLVAQNALLKDALAGLLPLAEQYDPGVATARWEDPNEPLYELFGEGEREQLRVLKAEKRGEFRERAQHAISRAKTLLSE